MSDVVSILIGNDDEGNPIELVYGDNKGNRTTNVILNGAIGYDRPMWSIAIGVVLNHSPKQVLFYDVSSYNHDWTNTVRHYRRVLINKEETYYNFLTFLLEEMNKGQNGKDHNCTIVLINHLSFICNMRGDIGYRCRNALKTLLKEGPSHNMYFICRHYKPQEIIEHYEEVFNTEITIEPLFGPGAEIKTNNVQTNKSICKHFTITNIRFRGTLNEYLHRELCGPKYYIKQIRNHWLGGEGK